MPQFFDILRPVKFAENEAGIIPKFKHKPDMIKIEFTEQTINEVYQQFMEHPSGLTKKKLHVVYLKALGLSHKEIERIARTSADSVTRYLKNYHEGAA